MPERHEVTILKIVLDVLKPHRPPLTEFTADLAGLRGVHKVDATILEVDKETETVKLLVEGSSISFDHLQESIMKMGAAVHSIDQVVAARTSQAKSESDHQHQRR